MWSWSGKGSLIPSIICQQEKVDCHFLHKCETSETSNMPIVATVKGVSGRRFIHCKELGSQGIK